jgi:iron complex outermembrane recepter protein
MPLNLRHVNTSTGRVNKMHSFSASAIRLGLSVAMLVSGAQVALAQDGVIRGTVRVVGTGLPVHSAQVLLDQGRPLVETDERGRYVIANVTAGSHTLTVRRIGFDARTIPIVVASGNTTVDIEVTAQATILAGVTVIGSQSDIVETRDQLYRIPGGVSLIPSATIRSTRQANLKDVLQFTPGVFVQSRFGAADESQISVRGSGLRNNFHARGINLLVNGMPYRNADGFTDFESLELLTTDAIEVYKGANAFRFGGSTMGGAINLNTRTGYSAEPLSLTAQGGAFGFHKAQLSSGGVSGNADYYASYARTGLDGYRDWADQKRDRVNLHAGLRLSDDTDARAFYFFAHVREHLPGALTESEFRNEPTLAVSENVSSRWGRDYSLHHVGVQLRAQLTPAQRIEVSPYMQYRDIDHPIFEVISQISRDFGAEIRYENTGKLGSLSNRLTLGFQPAVEDMNNRQFVNEAGVHGDLTRDEKDHVTNMSAYAEDALDLSPTLTIVAGARLDNTTRRAEDRFLSDGDRSDERKYNYLSPRFGFLYRIARIGGAVFGNASRSVEPPLLLELTSFGSPGGFIDLQAQKAWQYEIGVRGFTELVTWELSLYNVDIDDEILNINVQPFPGATFTVPSYRNAGRTRHSGIEAGIDWRIPGSLLVHGVASDGVTARAAYTFARYKYVDDASFGGNHIPGAPNHQGNLEVKYEHPKGLSIAPSLEIVPQSYFINSENTVKNRAWSSVGLRIEQRFTRSGATVFAEGRNLADKRYSASTQVDNAVGRYFEPADSRSFLAGFRWAHR